MNKFYPYKRGYFDVTDGHQLYYELCGNPKGKPVLFIHGGPGTGFTDNDKRFFNPEVWNILLFDQRGSGRSKPFASLENNTTEKLVEDINTFLKIAGLEKVFLFGGSWGATLSLVYGIKFPQNITGMLLRGIYLATKEERLYYMGGGIKNIFPEVWERFISLVPEDKRHHVDSYYLSQMQSKNNAVSEKYTYEWAYYEMSILRLKTNHEQIAKDLIHYSYRTLSPLEAHFISNNCFLPDNYIVDNTHILSTIPLTIVQGRYDCVTPVINAFKLHKKIKNSQLIITTAGHASYEEETKKVLTEQMERYSKIV